MDSIDFVAVTVLLYDLHHADRCLLELIDEEKRCNLQDCYSILGQTVPYETVAISSETTKFRQR